MDHFGCPCAYYFCCYLLATSPSHSLFWTSTRVRNLDIPCLHSFTSQAAIHRSIKYRFGLPGFPGTTMYLTETFDKTEDKYTTHNYISRPATNESTLSSETRGRIPWSRVTQRSCAVAVPPNALFGAQDTDMCQLSVDTDG